VRLKEKSDCFQVDPILILLPHLYPGFAHVDKEWRGNGVSSDFTCSIESTTQDDSVSFSNAHHYFIDSIVLIVPSFRFFSLQNNFTTLLQLAFLYLFSYVTLFFINFVEYWRIKA
jgi:hypothetical protein